MAENFELPQADVPLEDLELEDIELPEDVVLPQDEGVSPNEEAREFSPVGVEGALYPSQNANPSYTLDLGVMNGALALTFFGPAVWPAFLSPEEIDLAREALDCLRGPYSTEFGPGWNPRLLEAFRVLAPSQEGQINWEELVDRAEDHVYELRVAQWGYSGLKTYHQVRTVAAWEKGDHADTFKMLVGEGFKRLERGESW